MEIGIVMGLMKYEGRMERWLDCKGNGFDGRMSEGIERDGLENGVSKVIIHASEEK